MQGDRLVIVSFGPDDHRNYPVLFICDRQIFKIIKKRGSPPRKPPNARKAAAKQEYERDDHDDHHPVTPRISLPDGDRQTITRRPRA